MRVRIDSLGCRLNTGEAQDLARRLASRGHRVVGPGERADLLLFNTCAVTHVAARKSRKLIRSLQRDNPDATVVVTGCYAELSPESVGELGVDAVVGNQDKDALPGILEDRGLLDDGEAIPEPDAVPIGSLLPDDRRTRAFVKVQDGCDNRCTFCIVTVARGEGRSRPADEVVEEIRHLVSLGYREAVLSGVHLGSYGQDLGSSGGLAGLVARLLRETRIPRLRLSSLEPWDLDPRFFDLWQEDRLLPHLHLPLQSGCDTTLERMARRTSQRGFASLVEAARRRVPDLAVTTDVIAGFPGETEAEFEESLEFVEAMDFAGLHVFRYSPRQGTAAARMPGQVDPAVAKERSRRVHALGERQERAFRCRHVGREMEVLWETAEPVGGALRWSGLTGNYIRVVAETPAQVDLANVVSRARLVDQVPGALVGEVAVQAAYDLSGEPRGATS